MELTDEQKQMQKIADGLIKRAKHIADKWFLHYLKEKGYYLMSQEQLDKRVAETECRAVERCIEIVLEERKKFLTEADANTQALLNIDYFTKRTTRSLEKQLSQLRKEVKLSKKENEKR